MKSILTMLAVSVTVLLLNGCAVVAVADAVVSTTVSVGSAVVGTTVDVAKAGVRTVTK